MSELTLTPDALNQIKSAVDNAIGDRPTKNDISTAKADVTKFIEKQQKLDEAFGKFSKGFDDVMTKEQVDSRVEALQGTVSEVISEKVQEFLVSHPLFQKDEKESKLWKFGKTEYTDNQEHHYRDVKLCHKLQDRLGFTKANESMNVSNAVVGGAVETFPVWDTMIANNPLRPYITVMSVGSNGFKLPQLKRGTSGMQKNQAVTIPTGNVTGLDMTAATIAVDDYNENYPASLTVEEDVEGVRELYTQMAFTDMAFSEGAECVAVLKAATANGKTIADSTITVGASGALPGTDKAVLKMMHDLMANVPTAYRMDNVYQVSRAVEGAVVTAIGQSGGYAIIPGTTVRAFNGFPMIANDHCDDVAGNAIVGYFGNFRRGLFMGQRVALTIEEFDFPGATLYYARTRFKVAEWDLAGVSALKIKS